MLKLSYVKELINELGGRYELEKFMELYDEDILEAARKCDVQIEDIEEAYQGKWDSDEDFTRNLVEGCGDIPNDLPAYIHIDWEWTAKEIMMDYSESGGHYFRNL